MRKTGRLALAHRSIRVLRWIGFSEDDGKTIAEGADHQAAGRDAVYQRFPPLHAKGGSTSPKAMASESPKAQTIWRHGRNTFVNALRTTRSTLTGAGAEWGERAVLDWVLASE